MTNRLAVLESIDNTSDNLTFSRTRRTYQRNEKERVMFDRDEAFGEVNQSISSQGKVSGGSLETSFET